MLLATMPMLIALAILVTGVVLVVRGVMRMRQSARLSLVAPLGQPTTTGVASVVVGAALIGTVLALLLFALIAIGGTVNN